MKITRRQAEYLRFIAAYFEANDQMPSHRAVAEEFYVYENAADEMLYRMMRKGVLARNAARKYKRGPKWDEAMEIANREKKNEHSDGH